MSASSEKQLKSLKGIEIGFMAWGSSSSSSSTGLLAGGKSCIWMSWPCNLSNKKVKESGMHALTPNLTGHNVVNTVNPMPINAINNPTKSRNGWYKPSENGSFVCFVALGCPLLNPSLCNPSRPSNVSWADMPMVSMVVFGTTKLTQKKVECLHVDASLVHLFNLTLRDGTRFEAVSPDVTEPKTSLSFQYMSLKFEPETTVRYSRVMSSWKLTGCIGASTPARILQLNPHAA